MTLNFNDPTITKQNFIFATILQDNKSERKMEFTCLATKRKLQLNEIEGTHENVFGAVGNQEQIKVNKKSIKFACFERFPWKCN